jgi:hypothetical protein
MATLWVTKDGEPKTSFIFHPAVSPLWQTSSSESSRVASLQYYACACAVLLKCYINSSASGACVKSFQAPSRWTLSQDNPGDRLDMSAQCKKHLNNPSATAETNGRTPQDICRNLKCRAPAASAGSYYIYTLNRVPGDDTPCGTNLVRYWIIFMLHFSLFLAKSIIGMPEWGVRSWQCCWEVKY